MPAPCTNSTTLSGALAQRQVDASDIYSTDAKIRQYGLRVLDDDKQYFPRYDAVLLYRLDLPTRLPKAWAALQTLEGRIDMGEKVIVNIKTFMDGHRPPDRVLPSML